MALEAYHRSPDFLKISTLKRTIWSIVAILNDYMCKQFPKSIFRGGLV